MSQHQISQCLTQHSKANHIFIQPHRALAENIVSHQISPTYFVKMLESEGFNVARPLIVTRYYYEDLILEVTDSGTAQEMRCYITYVRDAVTIPEHGTELVIANQFNLSIMRFPLRKQYHHERQAIVYRRETGGWILELEVLVSDILPAATRRDTAQSVISHIRTDALAEAEDAPFSLSYRLYLKERNSFQQKYSQIVNVAEHH